MPQWLRLDPQTGEISATEMQLSEELVIQIEIRHAEGVVMSARCGITNDWHMGLTTPWALATQNIMHRFNDAKACNLDHGVRTVLLEHFAEVYDFSQYAARDRTLGQWLDVMGCVLRMLRSTSVANLASRVG